MKVERVYQTGQRYEEEGNKDMQGTRSKKLTNEVLIESKGESNNV